jgi:predicted O-methyltransferase YrrM
LFWCHFFGATVTCIDAWQQVAKGCRSAAEVEQHFDANIHGLPIVKLKQNSAKALAQLNESFDLVYIDGDHSRLQVMIDTCLAWRLLRSRGIMIWDDYTEYRPDLIDRPAPAIDAFLYMMKNEVRVLRDTGQQLIVQKLLGD